jgi:hypothetical protein
MHALIPLEKRVGRRMSLAALALLAIAALGACEAAEGSDEARVFFQEPLDGATVTSPVTLVFGHENIELGAVPEVVDSPRPGVIHHHVGLNTDCLPPGTEVPQADPWIHFGDGSNEIEMNLPPGEHRIAVQAGDDEHRTIEGLCEVITITVTEEG